MVLRKCPACHELVGGESTTCPRCGVTFRAAAIRRVARWILLIALLSWAAAHYLFSIV
jgi:uncharacterized paraquat-inducible protein A